MQDSHQFKVHVKWKWEFVGSQWRFSRRQLWELRKFRLFRRIEEGEEVHNALVSYASRHNVRIMVVSVFWFWIGWRWRRYYVSEMEV